MKRPLIKQDDLQAVLTARLVVEAAKAQLRTAEDERDKLELILVDKIANGAPVAPGELDAGIRDVPGARRPKWKEAFAEACGPAAVERVIAQTEPGPARRELVILTRGRVTKSA